MAGFILAALNCRPQNNGETPGLEFVMQLDVNISEPYYVGETPEGFRTVIPITGGTFAGPRLKGEIIPGGADYQLSVAHGSITKLEAIYSIRTDDGVYIHVRNRGIITTISDEEGKQQPYFKTSPLFEAPIDSDYTWLNQGVFVCQPTSTAEGADISLQVWLLK